MTLTVNAALHAFQISAGKSYLFNISTGHEKSLHNSELLFPTFCELDRESTQKIWVIDNDRLKALTCGDIHNHVLTCIALLSKSSLRVKTRHRPLPVPVGYQESLDSFFPIFLIKDMTWAFDPIMAYWSLVKQGVNLVNFTEVA